jgi:adenine phosphoribosyltransferase
VADPLAAALRTIPDFPTPGIQFKDITPVLADPSLFSEAVDRLKAPFAAAGVTHVVGIESRGFWFGPALAERLGAGFVPARKPGKLPAATIREHYSLEYGADALEIHADALPAPARALVHDDVVATGGTAAAAARLVRRAGAEVVGFSFFVELAFLDGRARLLREAEGVPFRAVLRVD